MIAWDQIEAECDGYRAGFVAVFRKYEGQPTDEKDGQGRTVKVTASSFAEHVGVADRTFRRWVEQGGRRGHLGGNATSGTARTGQIARQAVKSESVSVDDKVGMLQDLLSDNRVVQSWRETRAPAVNEADAKAARAWAKAITDPVMESTAEIQVPLFEDWLKQIHSTLNEWHYSEDAIQRIGRWSRKVVEEVEVQEFRLGLREAV